MVKNIVLILLAVVGVGNLVLSGVASQKPFTKEGKQDNTERRKYDATTMAIESYRDCVKKRGIGGTISIPSSFNNAPPVRISEPSINCEAIHSQQLQVAKNF